MWLEKEKLLLHTTLRDNIPPRAAILTSQNALGQEIIEMIS